MKVSLFLLLISGVGQADEVGSSAQSAGTASKEEHHFRVELKREATSRGMPDETTKTSLKIDALLRGTIAFLRLDLPFPDEKMEFDSSPFSPRLGDIKVRVGFQPVRLHAIPLSSFVEAGFPTASSEELGSGKYQLSAGLRASMPVSLSERILESHKLSFDPLIQQFVSVAGDENRKGINYTKFELGLKDTWLQKYWVKLVAKPVIDWEQAAKTGAVAELESGWNINRHWALWLMWGARLWGESVPSTYSKRVGIGVARLF